MTQKPEIFLTEPLAFEWDDGNRGKNEDKHGVRIDECEQAFSNRPLIVTPDEDHSQAEARWFSLGQTDEGRLLFVAFTMRGTKLRVISARDMSRQERRVYSDEKA